MNKKIKKKRGQKQTPGGKKKLARQNLGWDWKKSEK